MLHKILETGETDDKCNNLLKYSCYACYQDYFFSLFIKLDMLIATMGIITKGAGLSNSNCYDKKNFSFHSKDQGKHLYKFFIFQC